MELGLSSIEPLYPLLVVIREAMQNEIIWWKQLTFFWSFSLCKGTFTHVIQSSHQQEKKPLFHRWRNWDSVKVIGGVTRGTGTRHEFSDSKSQLFSLHHLACLKRQTLLFFFFFFKLAYNNSILIIGQVFLDGLSMNMPCNPQSSPIGQSLLLSSLHRWGNWDREAK